MTIGGWSDAIGPWAPAITGHRRSDPGRSRHSSSWEERSPAGRRRATSGPGLRAGPAGQAGAAYAALAEPSSKVPVSYYSEVAPGLFAGVIAKYRGDNHAAHAAESN